MQIPLLDLKSQYNSIKEEIQKAINRVLESGEYILGSDVTQLEKEIAQYCKVKYAVGVASGTDALLISLKALGIKPGDEVIIPTFTFFATAGVICRLGAIPVFIDINPITYNIAPELIERKITNKTKAIIPVHLFGLPAEMTPLNKIAAKYNLKIVEDACQAIGAVYKGIKVGNLGDAAAISFYPSKNLGCYGDGGMILTNNTKLFEKIKRLRVHGSTAKYYHKEVGYNSRLDTLQAAILRVKIKYLDHWNEARQKIAQTYQHLLTENKFEEILSIPHFNKSEMTHVFHQYIIRTKNRDSLQDKLNKLGIKTKIYYPHPLHLQECFKEMGYQEGDLPKAEKACKEVLALPIDPALTEEQIVYVVSSLKKCIKGNNYKKKRSVKSQLLEKIKNKSAVVGVIGLGYVGLPLAVEKAKAGYRTIGFDIQDKKIEMINQGVNYIGDVLNTDLKKLVQNNMLKATKDFTFIKEVDCVAICVPTPLDQHYHPDTSYLLKTTEDIKTYLHQGMLIILESTTYPGTTEEFIKPILEKTGLKADQDFFLAFSPERVDPGNKIYRIKNTPRIVGGIGPDSTEIAAALYENILESIVHRVTSPKIAEMEKLLENTFRNINIALVNEMAVLCNKMNISIWEVIKAASTKPYGFMPFYPGPGVGGHCIPVDPFFLTWKAREFGHHTRLIEIAGEINNYMPKFILERVMKILNRFGRPLNGANILQLGIAYKKDVDDLRESPALKIFKLLKEEGAKVQYNDPYIPEITCFNHKHKSIPLTEKILQNFDLIIITVNHSFYDYSFIQKHSPYIFDTKNALRNITERKNIELL